MRPPQSPSVSPDARSRSGSISVARPHSARRSVWLRILLAATLCAGGVLAMPATSTSLSAANSVVALEVGGRAGVPVDAAAVVMNVTVANPVAGGFMTVWPCGEQMPNASNLNFVSGQAVPNLVIAKLGTGGKVCFSATAGTDVIADVAGFFPAGSGYAPIANPTRILDTRSGIGARTPRTFGEGTYVGGVDLPAGLYEFESTDPPCTYFRSQGGGNYNFFTERGSRVVFEVSDGETLEFGCQSFLTYVAPDVPAASFKSKGDYLVGADILPGRYVATGASFDCSWYRYRDFRGQGLFQGGVGPTVDILGTDGGFSSNGCGVWRRVVP